MTKTRNLFIFGGLAILTIGLAIGAYFFFFQADDGVNKEWRNDAGQLHREDDKPVGITYYESGEIEAKAWGLNGQLHREDDKPAVIEYDESGEITLEEWYLDGELIKSQP